DIMVAHVKKRPLENREAHRFSLGGLLGCATSNLSSVAALWTTRDSALIDCLVDLACRPPTRLQKQQHPQKNKKTRPKPRFSKKSARGLLLGRFVFDVFDDVA